MTLFLRAKARTWVGLALHQDRFSLVKLKPGQPKNTLEAFAIEDAPRGWLQDGKIHHVAESIAVIKKLSTSILAGNIATAISFPVSQVIQKRIKIAAYLNEIELETEIKENLEHYLAGGNEPLSFDYVHLAKDEKEYELLLVAARRHLLNAYVELVRQAGLNVRAVDVDVYALARAVRVKESSVILDVDTNILQLILIEQDQVKSIHPVLANPLQENFIQQLKRSIQFFCANTQIPKIEKIILTGKQSLFANIKEILYQEFLIQSIQTNFLNNPREPELLTAWGLTLRKFPA